MFKSAPTFFLAVLISLLVSTAAFAQQRIVDILPAPIGENERSSAASVEEFRIEIRQSFSGIASADSIEIPLFNGTLRIAKRRSSDIRAIDDFSWFGEVLGDRSRGDVVLTYRKGIVSGSIYAGDAVYEVIPRGAGHVLARIDQSLFPECGGTMQAANEIRKEQEFAGVDSGDRIDVLIVYTTATKNFLGGDPQARAFAQLAVDTTNAAYANSKVRQRVRLVHAEEYLFNETGNSSNDLSTLRSNPAIQALRNTHKADLVAMLAEVSDVCGVGYLVGNPSQSESGYSLTARSCAVSNVTLAHEMGHNMGSHHNPENSGSTPIFPYSYGHYVNGSFRTVMSYVNQCPSGCARRPYFSNPEIFLNGFPTGIDAARDNARSLNNTADTMANYRYSGSSVSLTNYNSGEMLPRGIRRSVSWTADNLAGNVRIELSRDDGMTWETLVAETPNDGTEPVTVWGRATRRGRIRVASTNTPFISDSSPRNIAIR